jgi:hypothetical protein
MSNYARPWVRYKSLRNLWLLDPVKIIGSREVHPRRKQFSTCT